MTLNLMIVASWGVWQSSDHRLTDRPTGGLVDDYSVKHLTVRCPDGTALITYTGIGGVGGTQISDWLRGVIRGRTRSFDETVTLIRDKATQWISSKAAHLLFNVGAFFGGHAWVIQISNCEPRSDWRLVPPTPEFHTQAKRVQEEPMAIVSGAREAVGKRDEELLGKVVKHKPRNASDFHKLLADVNERASQHMKYGSLISPACITAHMPPDGEPIDIQAHGWDPAKDLVVPTILLGIDWTDSERVLLEQLRQLTRYGAVDNLEFQRSFEEAGRRSVEPEERL